LTFATVALFMLSLAFSLLGDALRDALDPKLRT
jgi:ABC-type dipeptide/oligopeptide/nickel transport system permease subunit